MTRSIRITGPRRAVTATAAGLLGVAGALTGGAAASADTTVTLRYPVTGTTHIATPNADVPLGPGHLIATADLNTDAIKATLRLGGRSATVKDRMATTSAVLTLFTKTHTRVGQP